MESMLSWHITCQYSFDVHIKQQEEAAEIAKAEEERKQG